MYDVSLETVLSYVMCSGTRLDRVRERLTHNPIITYLEVGHVFNLRFPISFK